MKFCPQCGTAFEPEARFCLECGFDRSSVEVVDTAGSGVPGILVTETTSATESPFEETDVQPEIIPGCTQCGSALDKNDRFCPECGFDTTSVETVADEVSQPIQQTVAEEEIIAPVIPVEEPASLPANKQFCTRCGSGIDTQERFCQECGFDTISDTASREIKSEPVIEQPVVVTPPPPEPLDFPQSTKTGSNVAPTYSQKEIPVTSVNQQKSKKTFLWIVLILIGLGILGAAGWFVFKSFLAPSKDTADDTTITMGIPENTEIATDAINDEATEQPEVATADQPKATTKPMSRMDQELAKQKAKAQNQPAQNTANDQPGTTPIVTDNDIVAKVILEVGKKEEPNHKNPKNPTKLTLQKPTMITRITTDHYNDGMGTPRGGIITIKDRGGIVVAGYKALGKTGKNGTPSAKWVAEPNRILQKGTYYIWDSDNQSWSKTLLGNGFVVVEGYEVE